MFKIHPMNEKQLPSYPLRMPPEVREQVEAAAKASGRSMNAEIVARLQTSFQRDESEEREFEAWREMARRERGEASAQTMVMPLDTERALKEYAERIETMMAAREDRMREWWQKEFGYDPQAPKVERPTSSGPVRSPNARRKTP